MKKSISVMLVLSIIAGLFEMCGVTAFAETTKDTYSYFITDGKVTITDCDEAISGDVVIPDSIEGYPVTSIFEAFMDCKNITSITIPDSVRGMSEASFFGCENLKTVNFGNGITRIEQFMFIGCVSLESINIPDNVTEIGLAPFDNCSSLESIRFGKNLELIEDFSFSGCVSLKKFIVDEENANFSNDEHGVLFNKDKTVLLRYPSGKTRESYIVPEGVVSIDYGAFDYCSFLKSVEFPTSTTTVYPAFEGTALEKITFNNKNCIINFDENSIPATAVIYGYTGSSAETYAKQYHRKFVAIDDDLFSMFIRFFESFADLIKAFFNRLLAMFSIV